MTASTNGDASPSSVAAPAGQRAGKHRGRHQHTAVPLAETPTGQPRQRSRLPGLEGLRGAAAVFVLLHHIYINAYLGFPQNTGPWFLAWLLYGHFAVALFIVISGFSLAVAPARAGWRIDSMKRFFYRRAWRILPTYWPALVLSLLISWFILTPDGGVPGLKSVLINAFLVQDIFGASSPNGAFWSIPIEVQLYLLFPLMIWTVRRYGSAVMVTCVTVPVVFLIMFQSRSSFVHLFARFTPQLAVLFALGVACAGLLQKPGRLWSTLPWLALVSAIPALTLIVVKGSVWSIGNLGWLDLAIAVPLALLVTGVAVDHPAPLTRLLDTRIFRSLGGFSFSLYATHAPIIAAWYVLVLEPRFGHGNEAFVVTLLTGVPLALICARLFAAVFELPFTRARSWPVLRATLIAQLDRLRRPPADDPDSAVALEPTSLSPAEAVES